MRRRVLRRLIWVYTVCSGLSVRIQSKILLYVWQTVWTLIRCHVLRLLNWVYIVCKGLYVPILRVITVFLCVTSNFKNELSGFTTWISHDCKVKGSDWNYKKLILAQFVLLLTSGCIDLNTGRSINVIWLWKRNNIRIINFRCPIHQ